ncbi:hypothetical protein JOC70_000713 [Clostridium pascui]|uniref:DEAD/DEAH box helicase family protein n=1 Tax=Clostridium pascui TaxID=46609 RepID=UPI00195A7B77|nr:DEAD/DEAH box helicase family protein [Clostridium pascui]MBM7869244.1 hypothetical protein [Clostridium pascui]
MVTEKQINFNMNDELWLNEAMLKFNKKFYKGVLNILNAPAGSGKSKFVFNEFLNESYKYVHKMTSHMCYKLNLNKVLYVCDTNMLKSSILEENKDITKILEKGDLQEAMKATSLINVLIKGDIGKIKVITYSSLGWLLQQDGARYILLNHFNVILMDEMQNLFKYANRFDTEKNEKPYETVINYLPTLVNNSLIIALSATTGRIYNGLREKDLNTNTIFTWEEHKQIKQYRNKYESECKYMINEVKWLGIIKDVILNKFKYKTFIYTNTIRQSEKYKQQLEKYGYKAEWLCSINNTKLNEDGEVVPKMNEYQLEIRDNLIKTGMLPDDLDVIIVNSGYETGWNLRDERVQVALIDSTDDSTQIQARNRIRHNIEFLKYTAIIDSYGEVYEYRQYRQLERKDYSISQSALKIKLDDKFLNKKITKEDKDYLVDMYAIIWFDKNEANWKTFKKDLEDNDYIVDTNSHGTYIYTKDQYDKLKSEEESKLPIKSNKEKIINWIQNIWDGSLIKTKDMLNQINITQKQFDKAKEKDNELKEHLSKFSVKRGYYQKNT